MKNTIPLRLLMWPVIHLASSLALTRPAVGQAGPPSSHLAAPPAGAQAPMEKRHLFDGRVEKVWSTAESESSAITNRAAGGTPALRWHITVDHYGGEAKYPIGWPRLWRAFQGRERDWAGFDYLEFRVRASTPRERLPVTPVTLLVRSDATESSWSRALVELKKEEWVAFTIPIAQLPKPEAVSQLMFSISDENYRHKDEVEFTIADLALAGFAGPTLLDFAPEQVFLFNDAAGVPVRFRVSGLKAGKTADVVCELRHDGGVVARAAVPTGRGSHRLLLKPGEKPLRAGAYEVVGRVANGPPQIATVRLVESPWREGGVQ